MRALIALTVLVYLVPACLADDWTQLHEKGLEAVRKRDFVTAAEYFQQSHARAQTGVQSAVSSNDLGIVLHQAGREAEAAKWLQRALDYWKSDPPQRNNIAQTSLALATVDRMTGDYRSAEALLRSLLTAPTPGGDTRSRLLSFLSDMMREESKFAESRRFLMEAEAVPGISWKRRLEDMVIAAQLDHDTHNWDASVDEWNRAEAMALENRQPAMEASCTRGLGQTWLDRGDLSRAEPLLKRALAMYEAESPRDDSQVATVLSALGQLYLAEDKSALAEEALNRALAGEEHGLGPAHPQVALLLEFLADAVAHRNQMDLARGYLDRAETIMTGQFGEKSVVTAAVIATRGSIEKRAGQPDRAALEYRKALDLLRAATPDLDPFRLRVMKEYAQVLKATHHEHEAREVLVQARNFQDTKR